MYNKYEKVNWEDFPSTKTPVNAKNLGIMDQGIYDLDRYVDNTIGGLAYESMLGKNFDDFRGGGDNLIPNGWDSFEPYGSGVNYVYNWNFENDDLIWNGMNAVRKIENQRLVVEATGEDPKATRVQQVFNIYSKENMIRVKARGTTGIEISRFDNAEVNREIVPFNKDEWIVVEVPFTVIDRSKEVTVRIYITDAEKGVSMEIDWIHVTPVDNQHLVVEKTPLENGLTRIQTWGGDYPRKLNSPVYSGAYEGSYRSYGAFIKNNADSVINFHSNFRALDAYIKPNEEGFYHASERLDGTHAIRLYVLAENKNDNLDFIASDPIINEGDKHNRTPLVRETGNTKYKYKIKFYGEGEEILTYKGDSVIEKGKEYSYVLSLKNTAEDLRLRDNLSGRTIEIKQGEQLIEYTGVAQKTEKVDFTLLSKDKDLELEINPPRMVQGSYVTLEPIRDSYNTVVERSNKLEEELGQHRFKELPNLIPDGWNSFEPYGSTENLIENGWDNFVPIGNEGKITSAPVEVFDENYVPNELYNSDFSRNVEDWDTLQSKVYMEGNYLKIESDGEFGGAFQRVHGDKGDVFYLRAEGMKSYGDVGIFLADTSSRRVDFKNAGEWETLSLIHTKIREDEDNMAFNLNRGIGVSRWKNSLVVNLTKFFGKGKEPTKEWCDTNIRYYKNWDDIHEEDKPVSTWDNMSVYVNYIGKGLTRVRTKGGKFIGKLMTDTLSSTIPNGTPITYSMYVENIGKNSVWLFPNTFSGKWSNEVKPGFKGHVQFTVEKTNASRLMIQTGVRYSSSEDNIDAQLDFLASDPVINIGKEPSLNYHKEYLKNGMTEIRTWGGTGNTKLWYRTDSIRGELTNSVYIKNKGDVPVGVHGFGEKYDYVQPGEERVVTQTTSNGSPMIQILGGDGNLHFIAGPPKIVEGKEGQPPFTPEQILGQVAGPRGYLDLLRRVEELERIIKDNTR